MNLIYPEGKILLDTNILIYATDKQSPFHAKAQQIIQDAIDGKILACIADKTLYEFYAVLTSKAVSLSPKKALSFFEFYLNNDVFDKISSTNNTINFVHNFIKKNQSKGKYIFDIILIALMQENNISYIYTKNIKDFSNIEGIISIDPIK